MAWMSNYFPQKTMDVIIYQCPDLSLTMLVNGAPDDNIAINFCYFITRWLFYETRQN